MGDSTEKEYLGKFRCKFIETRFVGLNVCNGLHRPIRVLFLHLKERDFFLELKNIITKLRHFRTHAVVLNCNFKQNLQQDEKRFDLKKLCKLLKRECQRNTYPDL